MLAPVAPATQTDPGSRMAATPRTTAVTATAVESTPGEALAVAFSQDSARAMPPRPEDTTAAATPSPQLTNATAEGEATKFSASLLDFDSKGHSLRTARPCTHVHQQPQEKPYPWWGRSSRPSFPELGISKPPACIHL